ncbi:TadE family protein [Acidocella aromatica]|uniref:Flp pilus assembly protein TadG n=1 Tax=Acidocella aromatica TaxID=1303579 RepID=A0A840VCS6_9PROT|nr:TadE family protein [Acidocella aromatica]MBB5373688.1 Flp pilus assembly protein TadG [Acidocella aromatica]
MFALTLPLLLAITGLSVDVGMWYQNQVALQSAADSAALTSAMNDARLGATTVSGKATAVEEIAAVAADSATNSQFNFAANNTNSNTNPIISVSCCSSSTPTAVGSYTSTISYTATVNAPRTGFLSHVAGMGVKGLPDGIQYASAKAYIATTTLVTGNSCLAVNPQDGTQTGITFINDSGGGSSGGIYANNCSIVVNCGNGDTAFNPPSSAGSDIQAQSIVVAAASGCTVGYGSNLKTTADGGSTTTACTSSTSGCNLTTSTAAAPDPMATMGNALGDQTSGTAAWQDACKAAGMTSTTTSSINLYTSSLPAFAGHIYSDSSAINNYGTTIPSYTINPNTYCEPPNSTDTFTSTPTSPGTYFFPYGYNLPGQVTFGPGIYYFGGNLTGSGGNTLNSNGATLVFVGGATISMAGNGNGNSASKVSLIAPDASLGDACLSPLKYNNSSTPSADANTLDGTNGGGICGIAIYQGRNDSAGMTLVGNTASTIIGIIYAPKTSLTLSGGGGFAAGEYSSGTLNDQTGTLAVMVNSVTLNGNGSLKLNLNTSDNAGNTASQLTQTIVSTTPPWLIN